MEALEARGRHLALRIFRLSMGCEGRIISCLWNWRAHAQNSIQERRFLERQRHWESCKEALVTEKVVAEERATNLQLIRSLEVERSQPPTHGFNLTL